MRGTSKMHTSHLASVSRQLKMVCLVEIVHIVYMHRIQKARKESGRCEWQEVNKAKKPKSLSVVPMTAELEDELKGPANAQKGWPVTSEI